MEQYNSKMIYQDWAYDQDNCQDRILHDPIHFVGDITFNGIKIKGEFLQTPNSLD